MAGVFNGCFLIASVPVRFDHLASGTINVDHSGMRTTIEFREANCVRYLDVPNATKVHRIGHHDSFLDVT